MSILNIYLSIVIYMPWNIILIIWGKKHQIILDFYLILGYLTAIYNVFLGLEWFIWGWHSRCKPNLWNAQKSRPLLALCPPPEFDRIPCVVPSWKFPLQCRRREIKNRCVPHARSIESIIWLSCASFVWYSRNLVQQMTHLRVKSAANLAVTSKSALFESFFQSSQRTSDRPTMFAIRWMESLGLLFDKQVVLYEWKERQTKHCTVFLQSVTKVHKGQAPNECN